MSGAGPTLRAGVAPVSVLLEGSGGRQPAEIVEISASAERVVVRLSTAADRAGAAELTGLALLVGRDQLPRLEAPDEYYVSDLLGFGIEVDGAPVGELADVLERPAHDVLDVRSSDGRSVLVPFVSEAVRSIDTARRVITIDAWALEEPD